MNNKKIARKPFLKEMKIGCSVMDNEGSSAYIKISKNKIKARKGK